MAASQIRVNTDSLNRTRGGLQEKLAQIQKGIGQISEDMATLNSMWEGDAHEAFLQRVNEDIQFLNEGCEGIQKIIDYEGSAVTEYNKCEQQVADLISQIRI